MTIKDTITEGSQLLQNTSPTPQLDTEVLLLNTLSGNSNLNKSYLYSHLDINVPNSAIVNLKQKLSRRAKGEPIAYIIGYKEFYNLNFCTNKDVLIPRPETEQIVDLVIEVINNKLTTYSNTNSKPQSIFIDIGTGSGCIPISILKSLNTKYLINHTFFATDISTKALKVAEQNAKTHQIKDNITFLHGNLLEPAYQLINKTKKGINNFIITANLPYLKPNEKDCSIKQEPNLALYGGEDGLVLIRKLMTQVKEYFQLPTFDFHIFIEHSPNQTTPIRNHSLNLFPKALMKVHKDIQGLNRITHIKIN